MVNQSEKNIVMLFQGDSITDCGRNMADPNDLGDGYVKLVASILSAKYPHHKFKFINRGISGDGIEDLVYRWEKDCIALSPDWISILIGVNDTLSTPINKFEEGYRLLLKRIKNKMNSRIVLCEPFYLFEDNTELRCQLTPKIGTVHKMAMEFKTTLVPLDTIFQESCLLQPPEYWAPDGVHPSPDGHELIARSWIKHVDELLLA